MDISEIAKKYGVKKRIPQYKPTYLGNPSPSVPFQQESATMTTLPPKTLPPIQSSAPIQKGDWNSFVQGATNIANQRGYPSRVLLGQASLETGHGTSPMSQNKNNYFGYMAYDANPDMARGYQTPEASITDYIDLITKDPIYANAWRQYQQDKNEYNLLVNIHRAGYATDPNYVTKITALPEWRGY